MTVRVLDLFNFSNLRNPDADSGVQLQKELISAVLRRRRDFFFYLLAPRELYGSLSTYFQGKQVQVLPYNGLTRQQGGAYHFDPKELSVLLDLRKIDIDVLFLNQPELAPAFLDYFNKVHFFDVHSLGYIHWMDWKRSDNTKNRWNIPGNLTILTSILVSKATGCNSQYGKYRILREAGRWFREETVLEMDRKLTPLYPGVHSREILKARSRSRNNIKTIVFPFRTQKYTGFKSLVEVHLTRLWKKRRDFRLVLTNPSDYDYIKKYPERFPFLEVRHLDRKEYLEALWKADIVVGCHNGANQWSLAVVEAMAAECVPLLNRSSFFREMLAHVVPTHKAEAILGRHTYFRSTFPRQLEALLDNLPEERRRFRSLASRIRKFYDWESRVGDWIECFELVDEACGSVTAKSKIIRRLVRYIRKEQHCSKAQILRYLDWHPKSRQIPWSRYRNYLRGIFEEDSTSAEVSFHVRLRHARPSNERKYR